MSVVFRPRLSGQTTKVSVCDVEAKAFRTNDRGESLMYRPRRLSEQTTKVSLWCIGQEGLQHIRQKLVSVFSVKTTFTKDA